jgi:Tol biopolymer transport system component
MLFDLHAQDWKRLLHVPSLNEPCWSHDSRFIYVDSTGNDPAVYRVSINDGKTERLVSLKEFRRGFGKSFGFWLGLTPQDEMLLFKDISEPEIYALDMSW